MYMDEEVFAPVEILLEPNGKMPEYADDGAAGMDLFLNLKDGKVDLPFVPLTDGQDYYLHPGNRATISVGFSFAIPKGIYGEIKDRSGLAHNSGLTILGGIIDSSYRGVIKVILLNTGTEKIILRHHMKIAQMILLPYLRGHFSQVSMLTPSSRGENGFGSTGA